MSDERAHFIKAHNEYLTPPSTYMQEAEEDMAKTASKISSKQAAVDMAWLLYNKALDACEELSSHIDDAEIEFDLDLSIAGAASSNAYYCLESPYSEGPALMPRHSSEGGRA